MSVPGFFRFLNGVRRWDVVRIVATVVVAVPRHVPGDAKAHLEAFAAEMPPENPRAELLESARN